MYPIEKVFLDIYQCVHDGTMAGFIDFSQIFSDDLTSSRHSGKRKSVQPGTSEDPSTLDVHAWGDAGCTKGDLNPSQTTARSQHLDGLLSQSSQRKPFGDVLLGSQFPLVRKVQPIHVKYSVVNDSQETAQQEPNIDIQADENVHYELNHQRFAGNSPSPDIPAAKRKRMKRNDDQLDGRHQEKQQQLQHRYQQENKKHQWQLQQQQQQLQQKQQRQQKQQQQQQQQQHQQKQQQQQQQRQQQQQQKQQWQLEQNIRPLNDFQQHNHHQQQHQQQEQQTHIQRQQHLHRKRPPPQQQKIHSSTIDLSKTGKTGYPHETSPNTNTRYVNSQEDLFDSGTEGGLPDNETARRPIFNNKRFQVIPDTEAVSDTVVQHGVKLRSVEEIPEKFRRIFPFQHFNMVQSKVFEEVLYSDQSMVLCSPTGSGKTVVLELAIVRLLVAPHSQASPKIVYMAPIKALCSEKFIDWRRKFEPLGLRVMELTGDSETDDFYELQQVNIVLTTPEKWDSLTRKWRENKAVMEAICLFIVDEIHILTDVSRGPTVEAVISRMKMIQASKQRMKRLTPNFAPAIRFLAVSATITNIEDLARWFGSEAQPALHFKLDERYRPVRLRKVVLGYNFLDNKQSEFQFDISLSYKLAGVIHTYSEEKPTLVFCATRKSVQQSAEVLAKDMKATFLRDSQHRVILHNHSFQIKETKLRDLLCKGIGYHHAGLDLSDRRLIEDLFTRGILPVLVATSTLAMGVNLPAHLVVIKSTMYYNMGSHEEYPDTQVLQMIGRAGRPQFDSSATAVIMTKNQTKVKYETLLNGSQLIESSLHRKLVEHLNAEIVLNTVTDISMALEWLKYTFLYIRVMKNPRHYGMPSGLSKASIEKRLQGLCMDSLKQLGSLELIRLNEENMDVNATDSGRLIARYCVSCKTAGLFLGIKGTESVQDLLGVVSKCEEFADIKLRNSEKKTLNTLNKDKNRLTIRYPLTGKIKSTDMKVNCLIQAAFGSLLVQDFGLQQDMSRICRAGVRVSRCLVELLWQRPEFQSLASAVQLCKCFRAKLWDDSKYVSKQLDGIGPTLSTALVNAGLTSFQAIEEANPREIELIVNRHPPFGNQVCEAVSKLPKYELSIEQLAKYSEHTAEIVLTLRLTNSATIQEAGTTGHTCTLLVGDADNNVLYRQRIVDALLIRENTWSKKLEIRKAGKGPELYIYYISQEWVGLDVECTYTPNFLSGKRITSATNQHLKASVTEIPDREANRTAAVVPCNHSCNKQTCGHHCCKFGVSAGRKRAVKGQTLSVQGQKSAPGGAVQKHLNQVKKWASRLPEIPNVTSHSTSRYQSSNGAVTLIPGNSAGQSMPHNTEGETTAWKKRDTLPELSLFMKLRENVNTRDNAMETNSHEECLPDLDFSYQHDQEPVDKDLELEPYGLAGYYQETEYGCTFIPYQTDVSPHPTRQNEHDRPLESIEQRNQLNTNGPHQHQRSQSSNTAHHLKPFIRNQSVQHSVAVNGNQSVQHSMAVNGNQSVQHSMAVNGNQSVQHSMAVNGNQSVQHSMAVNGNQSVQHSTAVNGNQSVQHSTAVNGNQSVQHSMAVNGNQSVQTSMAVNGNQTADMDWCEPQEIYDIENFTSDESFEMSEHNFEKNHKNQDQTNTNNQNLNQSHLNLNQSHQNLNQSHQNLNHVHQNLNQSHQNVNEANQNLNQSHQNLNQSHQNLNRGHQNLNQSHQNMHLNLHQGLENRIHNNSTEKQSWWKDVFQQGYPSRTGQGLDMDKNTTVKPPDQNLPETNDGKLGWTLSKPSNSRQEGWQLVRDGNVTTRNAPNCSARGKPMKGILKYQPTGKVDGVNAGSLTYTCTDRKHGDLSTMSSYKRDGWFGTVFEDDIKRLTETRKDNDGQDELKSFSHRSDATEKDSGNTEQFDKNVDIRDSGDFGFDKNMVKEGQVGVVSSLDVQCFHGDEAVAGTMDGSKWKSYMDSQTSVLSDGLNWQCPTQADNNQVVMKRLTATSSDHTAKKRGVVLSSCGERRYMDSELSARTANACDTQDSVQDENQTRLVSLPGRTGDPSRKYGQVLAWVSNPDNQGTPPDEGRLRDEDQESSSKRISVPSGVLQARSEEKPVVEPVKQFQFSSVFKRARKSQPEKGFSNIFNGV